jgi:uncharacterized membrane protein
MGQEVQLWLNIIVLLCLLANTLYTWITIRHKANKAAIDELSAEVNTLKTSVSVLEDHRKTAPTHTDMGNLYNRVNEVNGKLENVTGSLDGIKTQLSLITEYLISGGKR